MALDKQKILSELGSVVNQLQSADCGCMGKLFANSNQPNPNAMGNPVQDGYMGGCCHGHTCGHGYHGYNAPGAGEPFSGNQNCMGRCNPPKLFADTYNYLNHNLMQPVVKEVYDDLKSITPANTMMNNPMGAQMGLSSGNNPNNPAGALGNQMGNSAPNQMPEGAMGNQNAMLHNHHGPNVRFGNPNIASMNNNNMQMGNPNPNNHQQMGQVAQPMAHMTGMGANIVNMMGDSAARKGSNPNQANMQGGNNAEMAMTSNMQGGSQGQYGAGMQGNVPGQYNTMAMNNMSQVNPNAPTPNPQYMAQPNMYTGANANMQGNVTNGNMSQMNPNSQQMPPMSATPPQPQMNSRNPYGHHSAGIAKFNEMFPGVMQGGDLGFDPMAIAIQMNPANQQRAAMNTMQKMLMSNGEGINRVNTAMLQPVINATNAATANIAQANQPSASQAPGQQVPSSLQPQVPAANVAGAPVSNNQVPQQQVYNVTGAPTMSQQHVPQQQQYQQQYQAQYQQPQQTIDPNTGAPVTGSLPTVYEGSADPNARMEGSPPSRLAPPPTQPMIKDPIFPADTSRNFTPPPMRTQNYFQYNTLGQPVEVMPAGSYHFPEPNLPQTLSPQAVPSKLRSDPGRYSNVKSTVSKTSLMGNRPVGRTPSRAQLQQIYNQYKGSQSYTQQNIKAPDNGASYSEGHLNVPQGNVQQQQQQRHSPVERVGGDTNANNAVKNPAYIIEQTPGQIGDVPAANKPLDNVEKAPINQSKVRNGLQDQTYTSYATSAAWSFHGATPAPYSTAYRFRHKV